MSRRWLWGLLGGGTFGLVFAIVGFVAGVAVAAWASPPEYTGPEGALMAVFQLPVWLLGGAVGGIVGGVCGGTLGGMLGGKGRAAGAGPGQPPPRADREAASGGRAGPDGVSHISPSAAVWVGTAGVRRVGRPISDVSSPRRRGHGGPADDSSAACAHVIIGRLIV